MTEPRTEANRIVDAEFVTSLLFAETGNYCPARFGSFKAQMCGRVERLLRQKAMLNNALADIVKYCEAKLNAPEDISEVRAAHAVMAAIESFDKENNDD